MASEALYHLYHVREESGAAQFCLTALLGYCISSLDYTALCANLSGMPFAARHLVLRAFGLPYFYLAVEAAHAILSAAHDAPMIGLGRTLAP